MRAGRLLVAPVWAEGWAASGVQSQLCWCGRAAGTCIATRCLQAASLLSGLTPDPSTCLPIAGKLKQARRLFQDALRQQPDNLHVLLALAVAEAR